MMFVSGKLVRKNSVELNVVHFPQGSFNGVDYEQGAPVPGYVHGAPFNMAKKDIERYAGGQYTSHDIVIDIAEENMDIRDGNGDLTGYKIQKGDHVSFQGKKYEVSENADYEIYSDYAEMVCRRIPEQ